MNYDEFFTRFGGSARTKHLAQAAGRARWRRQSTLPVDSGLPREFIRLDPWEMETLWNIAVRARRGIVEVGRYNGGSTFLLACAAPGVPITSVDIGPQDDARLVACFSQHGVGENVSLIVGDSQHTKYEEIGLVDVVFIDGDHTYEGCKADIDNWYGNLASNGYLVFHDSYRGSWGVQDAIADTLEERPELQVVISPFIRADHWRVPTGSMACLMKRSTA